MPASDCVYSILYIEWEWRVSGVPGDQAGIDYHYTGALAVWVVLWGRWCCRVVYSVSYMGCSIQYTVYNI